MKQINLYDEKFKKIWSLIETVNQSINQIDVCSSATSIHVTMYNKESDVYHRNIHQIPFDVESQNVVFDRKGNFGSGDAFIIETLLTVYYKNAYTLVYKEKSIQLD